MRTAVRGGLFVAMVATAGCGSGPYPVSGQLVYEDGKPAGELSGWTIVFDSPEKKISSTGAIEADGRFTLAYRAKADGAMPGTYKVTIFNPDFATPDESDPKANRPGRKAQRSLPAAYANSGTTPLTATVEAKTNDITLTLKRP